MIPPLRSFDDVYGRERGQKKTDDLRAMTTLGPRTLCSFVWKRLNFGTYRKCDLRRLRRTCASTQSHQSYACRIHWVWICVKLPLEPSAWTLNNSFAYKSGSLSTYQRNAMWHVAFHSICSRLHVIKRTKCNHIPDNKTASLFKHFTYLFILDYSITIILLFALNIEPEV